MAGAAGRSGRAADAVGPARSEDKGSQPSRCGPEAGR